MGYHYCWHLEDASHLHSLPSLLMVSLVLDQVPNGFPQSDPFSLNLFIFSTQALTHIHNMAYGIGLYIGTNTNSVLSCKYHLFADDLFIFINTSRKTTGNSSLCLSISNCLSRDQPNHSKSFDFFPS